RRALRRPVALYHRGADSRRRRQRPRDLTLLAPLTGLFRRRPEFSVQPPELIIFGLFVNTEIHTAMNAIPTRLFTLITALALCAGLHAQSGEGKNSPYDPEKTGIK